MHCVHVAKTINADEAIGSAERLESAGAPLLDGLTDKVRKVLEKAGLTVDDIDLWEINEAFAVVAEKFIRDLKLDRDKVNVNGGACALGHPIGASGARILVTLIHALQARGLKKGLATLCIGGGEGTAMAIELI